MRSCGIGRSGPVAFRGGHDHARIGRAGDHRELDYQPRPAIARRAMGAWGRKQGRGSEGSRAGIYTACVA